MSDMLVLTAVLSSWSIMGSLGLNINGIERYSHKQPILNLEQYQVVILPSKTWS